MLSPSHFHMEPLQACSKLHELIESTLAIHHNGNLPETGETLCYTDTGFGIKFFISTMKENPIMSIYFNLESLVSAFMVEIPPTGIEPVLDHGAVVLEGALD